MTTMPTRIDGDLFAAAKAAGQVHSRSAAQQLHHWLRIGRELEASPAVTHDAIERVLTGQADYDALDDRAQAVVRATWDERIEDRIAALDLTAPLTERGGGWTEVDAEGRVSRRGNADPA